MKLAESSRQRAESSSVSSTNRAQRIEVREPTSSSVVHLKHYCSSCAILHLFTVYSVWTQVYISDQLPDGTVFRAEDMSKWPDQMVSIGLVPRQMPAWGVQPGEGL